MFEEGAGESASSFFAAFFLELELEALAVEELGGGAGEGATFSSCEAIDEAL